MGLWDKFRGELIDIIEWTQPDDNDLLAYRFPRYNNEIKMGAKLTVREGQHAVFVREGKIGDVFPPGMYELSTSNMPVLSTLMGWSHGFESPFKSEVYFVLTNQRTDNKWGTANPIMMRDADFGAVRIRAFGSYVFRVTDPAAFLRELVSTDPNFETYEIDSQLRQVIVSKFTDVVGNAKIPVLDLVGNYESLANYVLDNIREDFASWGLELTRFYVENISVPPSVEAALDKRAEMGAIGNLDAYTKLQAAEALRDAAQNPSGGGAGAGIGIGAGLAMGQQMAQQMGSALSPGQAAQPVGGPPPLPTADQFYVGVDGKQEGPFDLAGLQAQIQQGRINNQTLVWKQGMAAWQKANEVPELGALFAAVPPPLPPTA